MSHIIHIPEADLVYFAIPKAANTSVKKFLLPLVAPGDRRKHANIHRQVEWQTLTKAEYLALRETGLGFTVTRNPYSRLVSAYRNKICGPRLHAPLEPLGFSHNMGFEAFLDRVAKIPDEKMDIHLVSQTALLTRNGRLLPHAVFDMEELSKVEGILKAWARARGQSLKGSIPVSNATGPLQSLDALADAGATSRDPKPSAQDTSRRLAAHLRAVVEERYRDDVRLFGYSFPY